MKPPPREKETEKTTATQSTRLLLLCRKTRSKCFSIQIEHNVQWTIASNSNANEINKLRLTIKFCDLWFGFQSIYRCTSWLMNDAELSSVMKNNLIRLQNRWEIVRNNRSMRESMIYCSRIQRNRWPEFTHVIIDVTAKKCATHATGKYMYKYIPTIPISLVAMETHPQPKRRGYHRQYAEWKNRQNASWVNEKTTFDRTQRTRASSFCLCVSVCAVLPEMYIV